VEETKEVTMDIFYKFKHYSTRALLTFLGPADLDVHNDPRDALKRDYAKRYGKPDPTAAEQATTPAPAVAASSATPKLESTAPAA
jgi:hypothetical protein